MNRHCHPCAQCAAPGHRKPAASEVAEFKAVIGHYLHAADAAQLSLEEYFARWQRIRSKNGETFFRCVELAVLWFLAHEVGHAIDSSVLVFTEPRFTHNRAVIDELLEGFDLGPRTKRLWAAEIAADVIATEYLFDALINSAHAKVDPRQLSLIVAADVMGGVAAGCESLYQIELAVIGTRPDWDIYVPTHPPAHVRWKVILDYMTSTIRAKSDAEFSYQGMVLGTASKLFEEAAYGNIRPVGQPWKAASRG